MLRHSIRYGVHLVAAAARPWVAIAGERGARVEADALTRLSDLALRDLGLDRCAVRHMACMPGTRQAGGEQPWPGLPVDEPRILPGDPTPQKRS